MLGRKIWGKRGRRKRPTRYEREIIKERVRRINRKMEKEQEKEN
jgi:hypothetical protein